MSSFIVFIVIAIAWAVLGSLKAAADKVGTSKRPNPFQMEVEPEIKVPTPPKPPERVRVNNRENRMANQRFLKMEDSLPDFGDITEIDKTRSAPVKTSNIIKEPSKKKSSLELEPFLKGNLLRESIILSECLDRPRAYRPHPLNKQYNLLERRD